MDGALVIDKPQGITSHDVVAAARRILRERRIGHAGTLDPLATGVLVLVCGKATRLARFVSASDKSYHATILFGMTTDTYDVTGSVTSRSSEVPEPEAIERAAASLAGEYLQEPPAYSAKKVGGERAYAIARRQEAVTLQAVPVRVSAVEVTGIQEGRATISLTCSAGFYVRSFAQTLGQLVGTGACLEALRRTRSGDFGLDRAVSLQQVQHSEDPGALLIPPARMLGSMPERVITAEGREWVVHGRALRGPQLARANGVSGAPADADLAPSTLVRLVDGTGALVAVASRGADGALHPSVVLI